MPVWSAATTRLIATVRPPDRSGGNHVYSVAFSPDGHMLATAMRGGNTRYLWDLGAKG
jgi:WD40 repeat protein